MKPLRQLLGLPPQRAATNTRTAEPLLNADQVQQLYRHAASHTHPADNHHEIANSRAGDQRGQRRGSGMDYDDSRRYHPGDEPRHMNWRLSARSGELQMKVFREERRPINCVLLDRRNRMVFGSRQRLKVTQAAAVAALTSFTASLRGDQTAALILQSQAHWIDPREGRQAAFELVRQYIAPRSPVFQRANKAKSGGDKPGSDSTSGEASLQQALALLTERLPDGSQLTLISDFADLPTNKRNPVAASLRGLCAGHQVHAIHIADPAEIELPATELSLSNGDATPIHRIDATDPQLQRAFQHASAGWFAEREQMLTAAGAGYELLLTNDSLLSNVPTSH